MILSRDLVMETYLQDFFFPILTELLLTDELSPLSGGRHPVPVNDEHIVHVSNWAARKLGGKLRKITHAEEQVLFVK